MKNLIILSLFISSVAFSQVPKIELTPNGVEPTVVHVGIMPAADIYAKTVNWIENNFDNPNDVMVANIEDKSITIKAVEPKVWTPMRIGQITNYGLNYTLKIEFKDGRYRMTYTLGNFEIEGKQLSSTPKDLFKKFDGSIKYNLEGAVYGIENKLNKRTESLYNFIMGIDNGEEW